MGCATLKRADFTAPARDRPCLGDITSGATAEGGLYLTVLVNVYSRRVVGWAMAEHMWVGLGPGTLAMALRPRYPAPGLVPHTERGCPYTAAYRADSPPATSSAR